MLNDEIVDEVRAIREAHAAKFRYEPRLIYEDLKNQRLSVLRLGTHLCLHRLYHRCLTLHCSGLASLGVEFDCLPCAAPVVGYCSVAVEEPKVPDSDYLLQMNRGPGLNSQSRRQLAAA